MIKELLDTYEQGAKDFLTSLRKQWDDQTITDEKQYIKYHATAVGQLQAITDFRVFVKDADKEPLTRHESMEWFRDTDGKGYNFTLANEDKIEVFLNALPGQSDPTRRLLEELCENYNTTLTDVLNNT